MESGLLPASCTDASLRAQPPPARQRRIEHKLQPGETLQGLALKYGLSMEQIKRANRMYTNDSIFLKKSLSIPVVSDVDHCRTMGLGSEDNVAAAPSQNGLAGNRHEKQDAGRERASDLTPEDFLKRLDDLISQSKQAAVRGCQGAEDRVAALLPGSVSRVQQTPPAAVPLTVTRLTQRLRDSEDEIFQL